MDDIEIVRASRDELDTLMEWLAAAGRNPGPGDAACFWETDPEGFWAAHRGGELVGGISLVRYGRHFGFLGAHVVHPDLRGQGIGQILWQHALKQSGRVMDIGTNGASEHELAYRKSGFFRAHRNIRFGGIPTPGAGDTGGIETVGPDHVDAIDAYDGEYYPVARTRFLSTWLTAPGHTALAATADGTITGYGVIRPLHEGHGIGPLFADDAATAERLFDAFAARAEGGPVFVDPPAANDAAQKLFARKGLAPAMETIRMYHGNTPRMRFVGMYGITSLELG